MYLPGSSNTLLIHCKHTKTLNCKNYVVLTKKKSEMALKELEFFIFVSLLPDMVHAFDNDKTISVWILLVIGLVGGMAVLVGLVLAIYCCYLKFVATPNTGPLIGSDQQMYTTTEECYEAMENDISEPSFGYSLPPTQPFPTPDSSYGYSTQPIQPYVYLPSDVR